MNDSRSDARALAEAALSAASHCRAVKQLINGHLALAYPELVIAGLRTDGEKYRWIRGHRGNHAITEAIAHSDRNKDFDDRIDAAMTQSAPRLDIQRAPTPAAGECIALSELAGGLCLLNVDFLADCQGHAAQAAPPPEGEAVTARFDKATDSVSFCVFIDDAEVHATISAAVLHAHYGRVPSSMLLFEKHASALAEAVRDRVAGGSIEPIVLREYDLT